MSSGAGAGSVYLNVLPSMRGFYQRVQASVRGNPPVQQRVQLDIDQKELEKARRALATAEGNRARSQANEAKAGDRVVESRRREADAAGRVTVAESQLTDLRANSNASASRIAAAEERVSRARRASAAATAAVGQAETNRTEAERNRARSERDVRSAEGRLQRAQIQVDANTGGAQNSINDFMRRNAARALGIEINAETGRAEIQLALLGKFKRSIEIGVKLNTRAAMVGLKMLAVLSVAAFAGLGAQAAVGGLLAIVAAASQAVGAIGLLPAAGVAAGAVFGALKLGTMGVSDAFTSLGAASDDAGSAAESNAKAHEAAASALESAQKQVTSAERGVISAQQASKQAQSDLNRARFDAVRSLQDMNVQLKASALDEESAVLAVESAKERLTAANAAGSKSTVLERKEADLAYRQSLQSLEEIRTKNERLRVDTAAANKAGVEGSDQVVAAKQQVASASDGERDAAEALREALAGVAKATADAATAGKDQSSTAKAAGDAMAKLAPAARDFLKQVMGLKPAFSAARLDVQQALFSGLGGTLSGLAKTQLPVLRTGLSGLAEVLNGTAKGVAAVFSNPAAAKDFGTALANSKSALSGFTSSMPALGKAFMDVSTVGSTFLPMIGKAAGDAGKGFAQMIADARESGQLQQWIQTGIDTVKTLGSVLGNVGSIIGSVFSAGTEVGGGFLNTLKEVTGQMSDFLSSTEGQTKLQDFFAGAKEAVSSLAPILGTVGDTLLSTVGPTLTGLATSLAPSVQVLADSLSSVVESMRPAIESLTPVLSSLVTTIANTLGPVLVAIMPTVGQFAELLGTTLAQVLTALAPAIPPLAKAFLAIAEAVYPLLPVVAQLAAVLAQQLAGVIITLAPQVAELLQAFVPMVPILTDLAMQLVPPLVAALGLLIPVATDLVTWISSLVGWFDEHRAVAIVLAGVITALMLPALVSMAAAWATQAAALILQAALWTYMTVGMAAYNLAMGVAKIATVVWTGVQWLLNAALTANPIGIVVVAIAALIAGIILAYQNSETFRAIVTAAWEGIQTAVSWAWNNVLKPVFDAFMGAIHWTGDAATWLWNSAITPAFNGIGTAISWVWNSVISPTFTALQTALGAVGNFFSWVWNSVIAPAWNALGAGIAAVKDRVIQPAFDAIGHGLDMVKGWFQSTVDGIGTIWSSIRSLLAKPINFMIGTVWNGGILKAWNAVAGLIGIGKVDPLPTIPENAGGGPIAGPGTSTSDSILGVDRRTGVATSWVSANEFVVNAERYRQNKTLVEGINAGLSRDQLQYLAGGGEVTWPAMKTIVTNRFPWAVDTSDYRPGDPGYHGKGQALDIGAPGNDPARLGEVSDWIGKHYANSTQLIHNPNGSIAFGKQVDPSYWGAATWSQHADHVHWANDRDPQLNKGEGPGFLGRIVNGVKSAAGAVTHFLREQVGNGFNAVTAPIGGLLDKFGTPPPEVKGIPRAMFNSVREKVYNFAVGKADQQDAASSSGNASMGPLGGNSDAYAREIFRSAVEHGMGKEGGAIGVATSIVETGLKMYANAGVPASLSFPHDAVGSDHDSVGLFQQRQAGWGTLDQRMNPHASADLFFNKLGGFNWRGMDPGAAAQRVQVSAFPARYAQEMGRARSMVETFDNGGVANGKGFLFKDIIAPERVLDPAETVAYEQALPILQQLVNSTRTPAPAMSARDMAALQSSVITSDTRQVQVVGQDYTGATVYHYDPHEEARRLRESTYDALHAAGLG